MMRNCPNNIEIKIDTLYSILKTQEYNMLGLRTAFGGGGGPGSNIAKQVAIIVGVWIVVKSVWNNPPPSDPGISLYGKPKLISH